MVKTPKSKLTATQRNQLLLLFNGWGRTQAKRKFAKRTGIAETTLHRALKGELISDFIIKKITDKI